MARSSDGSPSCRCRACCRGSSGCRAVRTEESYVFMGHLIGHYLADLFPGHDDSRLLALPRHAQQRALHRRGGRRESAQRRGSRNCTIAGAARRCGSKSITTVRRRFTISCSRRSSSRRTIFTSSTARSIPIRLMAIYEGDHSPELRDKPFVAPTRRAVSRDLTIIFR